MKKAIVNYTPEATAKAIADYAAGVAVEKIAENLGKTVRSIVAKLSREGVYAKKVYTAKDGTKAESKADIVARIANRIGVNADALGSLETATKSALKLVESALLDALLEGDSPSE